MAGNCYAAAGETMMDMSFLERDRTVTVVHGRPTLQISPFCKYGHAGLEESVALSVTEGRKIILVLCTDVEKDITLPRGIFYTLGEIDPEECFRYDITALRRWATDTGHWGPWEGPEADGLEEGTENV